MNVYKGLKAQSLRRAMTFVIMFLIAGFAMIAFMMEDFAMYMKVWVQ